MYRSLFEYDIYAPTRQTAMIPTDSPKKVISILDSRSSVTGSKYLNGEKYFTNSRFLFKLAIIERK
jgi:hypothetical protein